MILNTLSTELILYDNIESKIRYLCDKMPENEWSGVLFYTVEGSLDDGTFKATCLDICIMDIGTKGFTDFKDTPDIINYRLEHDLLKPNIYEGLIHSHNSFSAFFSSTDSETLFEEGSNINHFLSLIVCNSGNYVARITRKIQKNINAKAIITYTENSKYYSFNNKVIQLTKNKQNTINKTNDKKVDIIEYFNMNITKAEVIEPFKELSDRIRYINKIKHTDKLQSKVNIVSPYQSFLSENTSKLHTGTVQSSINFYDKKLDSVSEYNISKDTFNIPDADIKTVCIQLLTGNLFISSNTQIDINKWVSNMDNIYTNLFGNLNNYHDCLQFSSWVSSYIEIIVKCMIKKYFTEYDIDSENSIYLNVFKRMIQYLKTLPKSHVKDVMIDELENFK